MILSFSFIFYEVLNPKVENFEDVVVEVIIKAVI